MKTITTRRNSDSSQFSPVMARMSSSCEKMKNQTSWIYPLIFLVAFLFNSLCDAHQNDPNNNQPWNTADYFKREHSLSKPYQGTNTEF